MIPKMILEPRLNLDTKLNFEPMIFRQYKACRQRDTLDHQRTNPSAATAAAKSLQSCLILCSLIDGSPPGSPIPGILQARTLEWVAISFSNA